MHWLLSVPDTFSLREVIRRSGWLLCPPYQAHPSGDRLIRVERLGDRTTVSLTLYQAPAGLVVQANPHLSGSEVEEASRKVWHMLRLDEDLELFVRAAQRHEALKSVKRTGARLLRGSSPFEHAAIAGLVTWDADGMPSFERVAALVNRFGLPLPSNPTLHSFPSPERILKDADGLQEEFEANTVRRLQRIALAFTRHRARISLLVRQPLSATEMGARLSEELLLDPPGTGLLMLYLGRYDYIPTDAVALQHASAYWEGAAPVTASELRAYFDQWHPWGGLAYWLWDWSRVPSTFKAEAT